MDSLTLPVNLTLANWTILFICALLIGMSKVGIPGVSMLVVPAMALIFGGRASTGVLLPILITADLFAIRYYHKHAEWKPLLKALPWAFLGLFIALWIGRLVDDHQFKNIIGISVIFSLGLMLIKNGTSEVDRFSKNGWFAPLCGVLGGFATMIGNVAGPIFAIYLLALHLPKKNFIGTTAWFFAIINISKLPLQIFAWDNIHWGTFYLDILSIPFIFIGALLGIRLVRYFNDRTYRWAVIIVTFVSALLIFI